jgi:hypothetical protein
LFHAHLFLRHLNIEMPRQSIQIYHQQQTAQNS